MLRKLWQLNIVEYKGSYTSSLRSDTQVRVLRKFWHLNIVDYNVCVCVCVYVCVCNMYVI